MFPTQTRLHLRPENFPFYDDSTVQIIIFLQYFSNFHNFIQIALILREKSLQLLM